MTQDRKHDKLMERIGEHGDVLKLCSQLSEDPKTLWEAFDEAKLNIQQACALMLTGDRKALTREKEENVRRLKLIASLIEKAK